MPGPFDFWHDEVVSDPKAQVEKARIALRRGIASALVRKEQAEEALGRLRVALEKRAEDRSLAVSGGDEALVADIDRAIEHLDGQRAVHEEALATADDDIASMKEDLRSMDGLEREAERLSVLAPLRDADKPSVKEQTLDRVRASIDALEAETRLNDELLESERVERRIQAATAEASAKAKLAELKAQRALEKAASAGGQTATSGDDGSDPSSSPNKPKRTL